MRIPRRTAAVRAGLLGLGLGALTGCGVLGGGVYDAPLPGGADLGPDPITVSADFADVLDLVPQSSVRVDNVTVGRVTDIALGADGRTARVTLKVRRDVDLPAATTARLQQTSLLGEKYVALVRPEGGGENMPAPGRLADHAVLTTADTGAAATAEQVLGALSLVLNGGGIGQFQEISRELQQVGAGRTAEVRAFLEQLDRFVGVLDRRKDAITGAIDGLARLSTTLDDDRDRIASVLDELSPGLKVLVEQRPQLTRMLTSLDRLSKVTVRTLNASQQDMVRDLRALDPILSELAKAGSDLPHSLEILLTYPFPDSVLDAIRGDYLNVFMTTNFRTLPGGCAEIGCPWPRATAGGGSAARSRDTSLPKEPPPTMLPSTDSANPVTGTPTVPGPSILPSTPSSAGSASGSPSGSSSGSPSGSPSGPAAGTPTGAPTSPKGTTDGTPSGAATSEGGE
ncbi:MCE family protein [Nocardioides nitrophenolicus]|uniref:MCE family protein n=1 Tax=Nocardioides nitrophenolicus TaxID=60489 RepID=UPI00195B2447|nr:MCE family protein [Nocardioides nitrophenolicus]MBM7516281.1 phospholipid/cholesterol/gamma-HCH transport system substrate-binding protein [Nocardioides nitrophenolicus]